MKKHSFGSRMISMFLTVVMILSMVPVIGTSAATIDSEGYLGNIKMLNNGESISLPIKVNNFAVDGLLFEYLSDTSVLRDSQYFLYEKGNTYQLFPLHLAGKKVGLDKNGTYVDSTVEPDSDAMSGVDMDHSLHGEHGTGTKNYLGVTSGGKEYYATLAPYEMTDGGGTKYLQLRQYDREEYAVSGRTWRKLTRFSNPKTMNQARYAVIIYRVNGNSYYNNMLLTWESYDEVSGAGENRSQTVPIAKNTSKTANAQWQYAIIDLAWNLGNNEQERAAAAATKTIQDIYLKSPLNYFIDGYDSSHNYDGVSYPPTGNSMDLAAVAYFPYYGDAEQFVHYGLSLGCQTKYYGRNNRGFSFRGDCAGYETNNYAVYDWDDLKNYGKQIYDTDGKNLTFQASDSSDANTINTVTELDYALFGTSSGEATLGLLEPRLDENGRPVYKEAAVSYVAYLLQKQLTGVAEYPTAAHGAGNNNYGWKNAAFITGSSTTSGVDEARFGKDALGHSIDLGTALCNCVQNAVKGGGLQFTGTMGTYNDTLAKAKELVGTWDKCQANIDTWFDAAYYLLHNLYATGKDTAYDGDGYGEYEDDYKNLILPQVLVKDGDETIEAYCFDSGFSTNSSSSGSAVVYDKDKHAITMGTEITNNGVSAPFLPTSGNGTDEGETNSPYYIDPSAISRNGGYQKRDYNFTISGNGFFQYESDLFFEFRGDDDVYLFINGQLVLDIGSTHGPSTSKIYLDDYVDWAWSVKNGNSQYKGQDYANLPSQDRACIDALALEDGDICSFDFFYMERHGAGSNLRIVTNMEVTGEGLDVDKTAYQNDVEIAQNGIVDINAPIEYGFKITNDSDQNMTRVIFRDDVIGVSIDYENGLQIDEEMLPYVKNHSGNPLTVPDLEIYVFGRTPEDDVIVTCNNNEELKFFLENMTSNDGTQSGEGLWPKCSIQIRGIYYHLTDAQKAVSRFRNYVNASADIGDMILRGTDSHMVYQPGRPAYYQWVGQPVVIEREQLYNDLLDNVVASKSDLPELGNMILVPSDAYGVERQEDGLVNTRGGDVYLKINYQVPRSYVAYVTIRDQTNPSYHMTVPITIYVTDVKDSSMVLDYGLDTYLTDQEAIFDYELDLAVGNNVTGTVMGIAGKDVEPSYKQYDTDKFDTAIGNTENHLTLVSGSYSGNSFSNARFQMETPIYLEHNKPWVIEFEMSSLNGSSCLFSMYDTKGVDGNMQLNFYQTGSYGDITLGRYSTADGRSNDFGVRTTLIKQSAMTHVKLYNVIAGDGSNMIYCSLNGGNPVAMTQVYYTGSIQSNKTSTWLSGKDFTFNYIGCYGNTNNYDYGLKLKMNYLYVYEEGEQLTHYRWEKNGNEYACVDTGKPGYEEQPVEYYTFGDSIKRWRKLDLTLNSDRAWEIEFEIQFPDITNNVMLLSSASSKTTNATEYIYVIPSKRFIAMGSDVDGTYHNYGAILPDDFDVTVAHTYLLKNRVNADGTNMVYLYVDKDENGVWTEVGPLNHYSLGSNIGAQSTGLSGHDFNFKYIGGHDAFGFEKEVMTYLEVREDTALRTAYEWRAEAEGFVNVKATSDGNRIEFTKENSGIIKDGNSTFTLESDKLKFETSSFMDKAYTTYVALTIHDKEHVPTPLNQGGVNVAKEVQMYKKVSVIPANVVYYEDDFPSIHYVTGNKNEIVSIGTSTLDKLQSPDQDTEYGSDDFYQDDSTNMSGDHIHKIKINEDDSRLAWFAFRGTGFELISATNAVDSAMIYIEIYNRSDVSVGSGSVLTADPSKAIAWIPLIPEFDHQNNGGTEAVYQVPLIRWQREDDTTTPNVNEALTQGAYVVTINAYATYDFSKTGYPMMDTYVYLDGIRIYQPLGCSNEGYNTLENQVLFEEVRDYIVEGKISACEKTDAGVIISSGTVTWTEKFNNLDYTGTSFEGNKVTHVNDYLLKGPNNEVYMDGTSTESSLAFVVYRNTDEIYKNRELGLQIGVRAIDVGSFYGTGATGMKANLQLGVTDASGNCSWMHLATVTGGTEQYITIPYELCPSVDQDGNMEYHVVIRVSAFAEDIPAMVSFSGIKRTEGLELKAGIGEAVTIYRDATGQWVTSNGSIQGVSNFMVVRQAMMAQTVIPNSDAVRGENFVNDTVVGENEPAIVPKYPALSFEEEVQYHVFYTVQNLGDVALEDMGLITFDTENTAGTISDAMDVIPGAVRSGDQYIVHTNGIQAKKLGDTLYFKVYAKLADGSYVYSKLYNYSAKTYAMNQLKGTNDAVKPLVVAMLNYGTAAQEFFGYKTDCLMNAELTTEQQALVRNYDPNMATAIVPVDSSKVGAFAANRGFTRMRPSVTFGGAFSINYFFTPAYALDGDITLYYWDAKTYQNVDVLTVENAMGSRTMIPVEGGEYFAEYTDIAAKEIGDTVYVAAVYESNGITYCTGVLPYSLSLYCQRFADNNESSAQELAAATMVYGHYAERFFG